jgi:hypothetical protein
MLILQGGTTGDHPPSLNRKAAKKAILDHVLKGVLGFDDDDLLLKALDGNGLDSLPDVVSLSDNQIDSLSFDNGTGTWLLPVASRNKLRVFRSWNQYLRHIHGGQPVDWMDETVVNEDQWEEYRGAIYRVPIQAPKTPNARPRPVCTRVLASLSHSKVAVPVVVSSTVDASDLDEVVDCLAVVAEKTELDLDGEPLLIGHGEHKSVLDNNKEISTDCTKNNNCHEVLEAAEGNIVRMSMVLLDDCRGVTSKFDWPGDFNNRRGCDDLSCGMILGDCCGRIGATGNPEDYIGFDCLVGDENVLVDWRVRGEVAASNLVFDPGGGDRDDLFHISAFSPPEASSSSAFLICCFWIAGSSKSKGFSYGSTWCDTCDPSQPIHGEWSPRSRGVFWTSSVCDSGYFLAVSRS